MQKAGFCCFVLQLLESLDSGLRSLQDQRVNVMRTLVGAHRFGYRGLVETNFPA